MLIYDKKENSIDIYTLEKKEEEIKKYKKNVIQRNKNNIDFYSLTTTDKDTMKRFVYPNNFRKNTTNNLYIYTPNYETYSSLESVAYASLLKQEINPSIGNASISKEDIDEIFENYISGVYDSNMPRSVYEDMYDSVFKKWDTIKLFSPEKKSKLGYNYLYDLLQTKGNPYIVGYETSSKEIWKLAYLMTMPRSLYLLHLLGQGRFSELTSEDIKKQLTLFDIEYVKNIKLSDIQDIIDTGLLTGTMDTVIEKAETGSLILKKIKR